MKRLFVAALALAAATPVLAAQSLRWTFQQDRDASLSHIIAKINAQTGFNLSEADFALTEDRDLAYEHYQRYDQRSAGVRIDGMSLRLWTTLHEKNPRLVQLEAQVEQPMPEAISLARNRSSASTSWAEVLARSAIKSSDDPKIRSIEQETLWKAGRLQQAFKLKASRGYHRIVVDLESRQITMQDYLPFPQDDYQIPALVYPIYEEYGGQTLPRQRVMLKHLLSELPIPDGDLYGPLRDRSYYGKKYDESRAATPEGQAQGYWSFAWLRTRAADLVAQVGLSSNTPDSGHALLQGRYVTINIHPDAFSTFKDIWIAKKPSTNLFFSWKTDQEADDDVMIPEAAYFGKPLENRTAALHRDASRHPQHDPAFYLNRGFDEVQVYYAVSQLFERLRPLGFKDPELSTRPFDAFLFNPDVEYVDNAYYDSDTINFTTYSPATLNMARDNTTIWHELGHGVMDRLMGTRLELADTGGLSEGMADFVAELVLRATNRNQPFPGQNDQRIINATGFFLTNEVHDDGEAYGGTMKAILDAATAKYGEEQGLAKVVDLVLEAMRLARDNPHLTAQDWFDRMIFADTLGRKGLRASGELAPLIDQALAARNFTEPDKRADFQLSYNGDAVIAGKPGSRGHEIKVNLRAGEQASYPIELSLKDGEGFHFQYPAQVKVYFNAGPLQGAIHWQGEEHEPASYTINAPGDVLTVPLTVNGSCDAINRSDGSCSDFAYVQIFRPGDNKPVAKKRFYLRIKTQ